MALPLPCDIKNMNTGIHTPQGSPKRYYSLVLWTMAICLCMLIPGSSQPDLMARLSRYNQVLVIPSDSRSLVMRSLINDSVDEVERAFREGRRLVPAGEDIRRAVLSELRGYTRKSVVADVAREYGIRLVISVGVYQLGPYYYGELRILTSEEQYKRFEGTLKVRSQVPQNVPLKLAVEIAGMLKHMQVPVKAVQLRDGMYTMEAGQWHGLKDTGVIITGGIKIHVLETGRYHSICRVEGYNEEEGTFILPAKNDMGEYTAALNKAIVHNLVRRKGTEAMLLENAAGEKRLFEGICIINPGGNLLLPAYGAFLSTHYMGFDNPEPSTPGLVAAAAFTGTQLTLPVALTSFRSNFFPWVRDSDKSDSINRLHIFLWATLPVTYTTAFFDQLAYQYHREDVLPPLFESRDSFAVTLSTLFPGGGLFYKGHRLFGWGYYSSEMIAAGILAYQGTGNVSGKAALASLGGLKLVELLHAWLVDPSYRVYALEMEEGKRMPEISMGVYSPGEDETCISCNVTMRY